MALSIRRDAWSLLPCSPYLLGKQSIYLLSGAVGFVHAQLLRRHAMRYQEILSDTAPGEYTFDVLL